MKSNLTIDMAQIEVRNFFFDDRWRPCMYTTITQSLNKAYLYGKPSFNKFVLEDKELRNFSYPNKLLCIDISHTRNKFSIQLPE